jgi:hypothetical protein
MSNEASNGVGARLPPSAFLFDDALHMPQQGGAFTVDCSRGRGCRQAMLGAIDLLRESGSHGRVRGFRAR